jgi:very-short-patch-repair endonuclease
MDAPPGIEIVVAYGVVRRHPGIRVHRRSGLGVLERRLVDGIPVTDPVSTLVDLAACTAREGTERAVNEADRLDLIDPEALRLALDTYPKRPGLARLRSVLDSWFFSLTDSVLERRFLALIRAAGLPMPETQAWLNGFRVDFYWPRLGLVVETDGLRYHRTPAQQARDRLRDQAHTAAGLTTLRFTAAQVRFEAARVTATLAAVAGRLDVAD